MQSDISRGYKLRVRKFEQVPLAGYSYRYNGKWVGEMDSSEW